MLLLLFYSKEYKMPKSPVFLDYSNFRFSYDALCRHLFCLHLDVQNPLPYGLRLNDGLTVDGHVKLALPNMQHSYYAKFLPTAPWKNGNIPHGNMSDLVTYRNSLQNSYKYLAFNVIEFNTTDGGYGPTLQELKLTYDGGSIEHNNVEKVVNKVLVNNATVPNRNDLDGLFNGEYGYYPIKRVQWDGNVWNANPNGVSIVLYIELTEALNITGGSYWTYLDTHAILSANLYGTNTDPSTFEDVKDLSKWNEICDLTRITQM